MEVVRLLTLDNQRLQIDSIAMVPRKVSTSLTGTGGGGGGANVMSPLGGGGMSSTAVSPEMTLAVKEEFQALLYVGSSDGCIAQFACSVQCVDSPTGPKYELVANQTQKRKVYQEADTSVSFLCVDDQLREPRLVSLCGGRISMLHFMSLETLPVFHNMKSLDGATICCICQGPSENRRLAAVVKKQVVLVEYSDSSCCPYVTQAATPLTLPDNVLTMAWHANILICGSKREYILYDVTNNGLVDHRVLPNKLVLGPAIRHLPHYMGGVMAIRLEDGVIFYDGKQRQTIDDGQKIHFAEPVVDVGYCHPYLIGIKSDGKMLLKSVVDDEDVMLAPSLSSGGGAGSSLTVGTSCRAHTSCPLLFAAATSTSVFGCVPLPPVALVTQYILSAAYSRAIRHYERYYGGQFTSSADEARYYDGLRKVQQSCGVHALQNGKYEDAFRFFTLAETPADAVARAVNELRRPSAVLADSAGAGYGTTPHPGNSFGIGTGSFTSSNSGGLGGSRASGGSMTTIPTVTLKNNADAYPLLFQFLKRHRIIVDEPSCVTSEQRDVDYALFAIILNGFVEFSETDLNELFLPCSALMAQECLALVESLPPDLPQRTSFASLLLASDGRCSEALQLCRDSQLVTEAIVPLQLSGEVSLYTQHLPWMLEVNPTAAIRALTSSGSSTLPPGVDAMLPLVLPYGGSTLAAYLDYVILHQRCRDPHVHTIHALNFIETIMELHHYDVHGFERADGLKLPPGMEGGMLGSLRRRLMQFLSTSTYYDADVVISNLLVQSAKEQGFLDEELVCAYRTCGEHELALQTLIYRLNDYEGAESYAVDAHHGRPYRAAALFQQQQLTSSGPNGTRRDADGSGMTAEEDALRSSGLTPSRNQSFAVNTSFGSDGSGGSNEQLQDSSPSYRSTGGGGIVRSPVGGTGGTGPTTLARASSNHRMTTTTTGSNSVDASGSDGLYNEHFNTLLRVLLVPPKGEAPRVQDALGLLQHHAEEINAMSVLDTLPGDVALSEIASYLIQTFRTVAARRTISSYAVQACHAEARATQYEKSLLTQRCVFIDDERVCVVCKRRVGDAVFGVFPNLKVAHFRCFKDRELDPERGVRFSCDGSGL